MTVCFEDFELDEQLFQLRRGGAVVRLEPKVYDVLAHLVRHRNRVVSKDELLETLWQGEFVSDTVLPRCIATMRKALGDARAQPRLIATVHGRGYRFIGAVREPVAGAPESDPEPAVSGLFVGREELVDRLHATLDGVWASRGRVLLLAGEPGIGKTRAAEELALMARRRGGRVLSARCYEGTGAPAFWPWIQLLRGAARELDAAALRGALGPAAAEIAQLVPEIATRIPGLSAVPALEPDERRFRLFDGMAGFWGRLAAVQPLVLVLDDLQWFDEPSLRLLSFIARGIGASRVLLLGTYRDDELRRRHPLSAVLGDLARESHCHQVQLRGLARGAVAQLVEAAGHAGVSAEVVDAVHELTDGNPFFVGEIVRLLGAQGRLYPDAALQPFTLPESVRAALDRRLDRLSPACARALSAAAVIGRDFDTALLECVLDAVSAGDAVASEGGPLEWLEEAVAARILIAASPGLGRYSFAHALVRQAVYEALSIPVRLRLHQRIAEALEERHAADPDAHLAEVAHHLFQCAAAGNAAKAVAYAQRAAHQATAVLAYEDGIRHYARALELLDLYPSAAGASAEPARAELLLALADAQSLAGDRLGSQASCRRATTIGRKLARPDLMARAALGFGQRTELGPLPAPELGKLLEEALSALGAGDAALRSRLLSRMAGTVPYQDSIATRAALSEEAVALAKQCGDTGALYDALGARLWSLLGPDHDTERLSVAAELQALAASTGTPAYALPAHEHRARTYLARGDLVAADRETRAFQLLGEELRQPSFQLFALWYWTSRAMGDGRFADAEDLMQRWCALAARIQHPASAGVLLWQLYWLLRQRGLLAEIADRLPRMAEVYGAGLAPHGWSAQLPWGLTTEALTEAYGARPAFADALIGSLHASAGRLEDASRVLERLATADFADIARDEWWPSTMIHLTDIVAALGDARRATLLYRLLEPFAERNLADQLLRTYSGSGAHFLGVLAAVMGRSGDAAEHFEHAVVANTALGARPAVLRTQYEYGRLLAHTGGRRRGGKAHRVMGEALG
jgi:DNA-binding winged helix-turn-helix (wHTH) protein/DNA polymerase III delta prime subunit